MKKLADYQLTQELIAHKDRKIYRAVNLKTNTKHILKLLAPGFSNIQSVFKFKNEIEIGQKLNLKGVIKSIGMETFQSDTFLVGDNLEGNLLSYYLATNSPKTENVLKIMDKLAFLISEIHKKNISIKSINPKNLIFDESSESVSLIDLELATEVLNETADYSIYSLSNYDIAYISPELTGRMNRSVDYRTDLYSLGVVFYELLTSQQPFKSDDLTELIYAHIAKNPIPPCLVNDSIPKSVSDVVLKLLAKNPEERYQSASGLHRDIQKCTMYLKKTGIYEDFIAGESDSSDKFQVSQQIYGRQTEKETLLESFHRVTIGGKEIVVVSGEPGVGKTVLINEIHKPVTGEKGLFISGKYQQFNRDLPYSGLIDAFKRFVKDILSQGENSISRWKENILAAVGDNGQVLIDVIPELELIVSKQPELVKLDAFETKNRFKHTFVRFIQLLSKPENPLVLFLDDMQWCDRASMDILEYLFASYKTNNFLLLVSYRQNEVEQGHPFLTALDSMLGNGVKINKIHLETLKFAECDQLVKDTLKKSSEDIADLSKVIFSKTRGNPFFVCQFLKKLHEENALFYNYDENTWDWKMGEINQKNYSDNMVLFLVDKLGKLNQTETGLLKKAACTGGHFDLKLLSLITNEPIEKISTNLSGLLQKELVVLLGQVYFTSPEGDNQYNAIYKFSHDQVQKAAYSIVSDEEKLQSHYAIGKILISGLSDEEKEEKIFDLVYHFNASLDLIRDQSEKDQLAAWYLKAGVKAKKSVAYKQAFDILTIGMQLIGPDTWNRVPALCLQLHSETAEAAYLVSDFKTMEAYTLNILQYSNDPIVKANAYKIRMQSAKSENDMPKALQIGIEVSRKIFGLKFPEKPGKPDILLALLKLKFSLRGKKTEDLDQLPAMTDPLYLAAMDILSNMLPPAYVSKPEMLPIIAFKQVQLSLKYGNSIESSYIYSVYGLILASALGDIENGYKFGELAIKVAEKANNKQYLARTLQVVNLTIKHRKEPAAITLPAFVKAYQFALESGDLEYYGNNVFFHYFYSFLLGKGLKNIREDSDKFVQPLLNLHQISTGNYIISLNLLVSKLLNIEPDNQLSSNELPSNVFANGNDFIGLFHDYLWQAIENYLINEDYNEAASKLAEASKYIAGPQGMISIPVFYMYDSLIQLGNYPNMDDSAKKKVLKKVEANQKVLKPWAKYAPVNFMNKYCLVEAEKCKALHQNQKAESFYKKAIELSKENGLLHEEGLSNELMGKFFIKSGDQDNAKAAILKAIYCYSVWGAEAVTEKLRLKFDTLITSGENRNSSSDSFSNQIDVVALIKASQALSEELDLAELLKKLLKTSIENAGATKGILLLNKNKNLYVEASCYDPAGELSVLNSVPLDSSPGISKAVVNYVFHTRTLVALDNACAAGDFTSDAYLVQNNVKSVLCLPIVYKTNFTGVIYFENNLATNAFTKERVEIINLLMSQIAISLENAFFYRHLEDKVKERTLEIQQQKEEIQQQKEELAVTAEHLEQVNKELEKLSIVASHTDNAVVVADNKGVIEWVNDGFTRLFGYSLNELTQTFGKNISSASSYAQIEDKIKLCLEGKQTVNYIAYNTTKSGENLWIHTMLTPILDEYGNVKKIIAIDSNITQLKEAEESIRKQKEEIEEQNVKVKKQNLELEKYRNHLEELVDVRTRELRLEKEKAQESDRLKSSFLANMSHEIRTPLNAIVGFSHLLSIPGLPDDQTKDFVDRISLNSDSLVRLIDNILDISRVESGQLNIYMAECNLNAVLDELHSSFYKLIHSKKLEISLDLKKSNPHSKFLVYTDADRLRQILVNLLDNAIKFTEKGKVEYGYSLYNDSELLFYVKDSGIGIEPAKRDKIFDRFLKIEDNKTKLYRGAGIGLSLSQALVEALGGKIWVDSVYGEGSTFYFTIRFTNPNENAPKENDDEIIKTNNMNINELNWADKTVLIAEDEDSNFEFLKYALSRTKIKVLWAKDGKEAVDFFENEKVIDLILMDIKMPIMNGLEASAHIKQKNKNIPIIAQTAYVMTDDKQKFIAAGCDDYLGKPINPKLLIETIHKYLQ